MASNYVWDKIRAAVLEKVSRMLGSSRTEREVSEGISPSTSLVNLRPSERTLCEEFYEQWEEDRQSGFKPPRKKMRGSHSWHSKGKKSTQTSANVEIKVGLAAQKDGVIKFRHGKTQIITVNFLANRGENAESKSQTCEVRSVVWRHVSVLFAISRLLRSG